MSKDIIIKIKENEDRKILFKFPYNSGIETSLDLDDIKQGRFTISFNIKDLKEMIEKEKNNKEASKYQQP